MLQNIFQSVKYWCTIFYKNIFLILFCCAIGLVLGVVYASLQKPKYEAELIFATESPDDNKLGSYASIAAQFGLGMGGTSGAFEGDNLIELLHSRSLVEKTLLSKVILNNQQTTLADFLIEINTKNKKWVIIALENKFSYCNLKQSSRLKDSVLKLIITDAIEFGLKVEKVEKNLNYVSVKYKSNDEVFSKLFVEQITENAIKFYSDYRTKKALQNLNILQQQLDSVRGSLYGNIENIASNNDLNINPLKQKSRVETQKKQVNLQMDGALLTELVKNVELSKIALRKETPLVQIIDTPSLPLDKIKIGKMKGGFSSMLFFFFLCISYIFVRTILVEKKNV